MAKRDGFNFDLLMEKMKSSKPKLLTTLEVQATNHFVGSWKKKGWVDRGLEQWREVKRRQPGTKAYNAAKKSARTRAILVQSGRLRRSFYTRIKRMDIVQIANSAPYAQVHNEGGGFVSSRRGAGTITAKVRGNARFVNGKFTRGRAKNVKLMGAAYTTKSYAMNIPQRQFMGHSHQLEQQQIRAIQRWINEAIRN
jgi:phage gpG-like protein